MRPRSPLLFMIALPAVLAGATRGGGTAPSNPAAAADTILRRDLDRPAGAARVGLVARDDEASLRMGLRRLPAPQVAPPPEPAGSLVGPSGDLALRLRSERLRPATAARPSPSAEQIGQQSDRFVTDYADLGLNVTSRMELGGAWTRYRPCDDQFSATCNPSLFPQLSPEVLFGVRMDGTILDRVHVDVDFDQAREFGAANRINIYYEGEEGSALRRLEVGDVTFGLPRSRFLTEGIPAGNFGLQAEGRVGSVDYQTVWAQQRGDLNTRVFQLAGVGDQRGFVQQDSIVLDDADYVRGQFYFLVDPTLLEGYPHVDALELDAASAPVSLTPGDQPIQLYRLEDDPAYQQQVEGFIQVDAEATSGFDTVVESGWFRYLHEGIDYFVHPSGLWIALRSPLAREEMLAVTYITAVGDTIGDYNPERIHNAGGRPRLRLLKASGANHQPGRPTWDLEMHQVYRVSSSPDVEPSSVALTISLGEVESGRTFKRGPTGEDITFLKLFGLDEEAPIDAIDPSFLYTPSEELFADQPPVQGTYVVFPTLRPFVEPPPLPSLGLDDTETTQILGDDANGDIYFEEDPVERDNSGRFRLTLAYRLLAENVISSFSLGAFGIRDGSERITLGDRLLARGVDYEIDYDVGQVTLLQPELLFTAAPTAAIRATWEQRSLFQVSPTQVMGLRTHRDLGARGSIDLLGLYRSERSVVSRPILGAEPSAALLAGLSASYQTNAAPVAGLLDFLPGLRVDGTSTLAVSGELAASLPNPNTRDRAFVDDFDVTSQLPVALLSSDWMLGSAPGTREGAESVLPTVLNEATAAPLTWQHTWILTSFLGDSVGIHEGFFPRIDIDPQIRVAGSEIREPGLRLTLGSIPTAGPGWRSITTTLATNGMDLTRTEFLEFYVSGDRPLTLMIDLGTVSEDAFFIDPTGATSGTRTSDGRAWGLGLLDQEADPRLGEIWSNAADERGVWNESCVAERGRIYRLGDSRANCTRGNGRPDSEDLDADGNLDTAERYLRFVVPVDGTSPYVERTAAETGTGFQLIRIPLRGAGTFVGGVLTEADLRAVRHMRITVVGTPGSATVARMRLVGSRWIKRDGEGVLLGLLGGTVVSTARTEVSSVSRVTEGDAYQSPPGVLEELEDPSSAFAGQGIEFNERSLGLEFEDLPAGARAEIYQRFPQRPRDFLLYREARLWVVARDGDFGVDGPNEFFLKVGNDPDNFYLYRTVLPEPSGAGGVTAADWLPEIRIDFQEWYDLRLRAETELYLGAGGPGLPPLQIWSADSTYAVVLNGRGRAPNLAAVREISMGVYNRGALPSTGEIWIDELRLGSSVRDPGLAGSIDLDLAAGGVLSSRLSYTTRGADFRQLRDDPSYRTDRALTSVSSLALDRWLPAAWGVELPLTLELVRAGQSPQFLPASDVRADRLSALRPSEERSSRVGVGVRKTTPSANRWLGLVIDGLDARAAYSWSDGSTVTTEYEARAFESAIGWVREPVARDVPIVPPFVRGLLRALLPGFLEDDVADARLRYTPERMSLGTAYLRQDTRISRFESVIQRPGRDVALASRIPRETMQSAADVRLRPFAPLTADLAILTVRDVLEATEAASDPRVQQLLRRQRADPFGLDLGWETNRTVRTTIAYRPILVPWLRNDVDWTSTYQSERNSNFVERSLAGTPLGADTLLSLARNARGEREWGATVALDPARLAVAWLGEPAQGESAGTARLRALVGAVRPLSATYRDGITSRFNRDPIDPGFFGYQLGWSRDDFRTIDADTAATLTERYSWRLGSGLSLPAGASVQVGFEWADGTTLDVRSRRRTVLRSWPEIQASLPTVVPPAALGIRSIDISSGLVRTERTVEFGGPSAQRREDDDLRVPVSVSVQWIRTLVTSYQASFRVGNGEDPTGETEREETSHRVSVSTQLLPPSWLGDRFDRPVSVSLLGAYTTQRLCRETAAAGQCVAFIDQLGRTVNLTMDTSLRGIVVGLQMSLDQRQSFVAQRVGSTQFQAGVFAQLQFGGGSLPFGG
ncbi:MAG: hypothetical protein AB7T31_00375 [Gemmatimonadales bacterium]